MKPATSKLNNIQVLRAFAATVVVVFHTGYTLPGLHPFGSFGVDVFFVISGYIMARILDPRSDSNSDHFFRRRVIRIVPPYWFFTILLYLAALRLPTLMGSTRATGTELVKSLFFIPFTKGSGVIQPLLFIGWSLNYEMFFYLALAVGVLLTAHRPHWDRYATWIGAAIVLAVMAISLPFADRNVFASFYSRDLVTEFVLGILAYYLCRAIPDQRAASLRIPLLCLALVSAFLLIYTQATRMPGFSIPMLSRLLGLGIPSFLLVCAASLLSQAGWDVNLRALVLVGDASYILYLIHPYCEYSVDRILGPNHAWLRRQSLSGALVGIAISLAVAVPIHLYAELPTVRFLNRNFGGKRKSAEFAAAR